MVFKVDVLWMKHYVFQEDTNVKSKIIMSQIEKHYERFDKKEMENGVTCESC